MNSNKARRPMKGIATILIVIFALICLGALLVPAIHRALRRARMVACAGNLSQLWKMENVYMAHPEYGGPDKIYPTETGGAFWLKLTQTNPALIDDSALSLFFCPVVGRDVIKGETDYLGPRANIATLGDGAYIGGDRPGYHGVDNGMMLRKSSDVVELEGNEFLEAAAQCHP